VLVTGVLAVPQGAQASPAPRALPHATPTWTAHAHSLGTASGTARVSARVYLAPRGGFAALAQAATAAATPGSATYHHFLTSAQYAARYQPTSAAVAKVSAWLRSSGLTVGAVEAHHRYVAVSGTVAAADKAFSTSIRRYTHNGRSVQAPATAVKVPAALISTVLTVAGLDTTPATMKPASVSPDKNPSPPPAGFRNARPCSSTYGQIKANYEADYSTPLPKFQGHTLPYAVCGYTGVYLRSAYEQGTNLDGSGQTVAITDAYASPTIAKDAERYASTHGDGSYAAGQFTQAEPTGKFNRGSQCGPSGWYGEETLDVEAVHAMAPGANVRYYPSPSCYDDDFLATLANVVDEDVAQVVTNSWSDFEQNEGPLVPAYEQVFMQGGMEGISFSFSSGDDGDNLAATGLKQVGYPSSDPYVTGIGGTSDAIDSTGNFRFQTGWGTVKYTLSSDGSSWDRLGFTSGGGGGYSTLFNRPAYQDGAVTNSPYRGVPDVALDADPTTGFLVGETQTFPEGIHYGEFRLGGTSLASPLFAGMTALALQNSAPGGAGLLNPTIYANKGSAAFTDIAGAPSNVGNVRVDFANSVDASAGLLYSVRLFDHDSSLTVRKGWDDVTGVGSPNPGYFDIYGSTAK
jgi:subtilase family serine protease